MLKKNPIILISEADVVGNKGAVAMLKAIYFGIKKNHPSAYFIITSKFIKNQPAEEFGFKDSEIIYDGDQAFDVPLVKVWIWRILKTIGIDSKFLLKGKVIKAYISADLIISTSGISFIDNFGMLKIYEYSKYIQIPLLLNKKIIKFTQTIGPFESYYNKKMAYLSLNSIYKVFARGRHTNEYLKSIGITKNVEVLPDIAVCMESKENKKSRAILDSNNNFKLIGISPNIVIKRLDKSRQYIPKLIELSDQILSKHQNTKLLFIPHTIIDSEMGEDDLSICKIIVKNVADSERCIIADTLNYTPEEAKWLIGNCSFFIGSRFHALIAAVSSAVPSIAIGWHWKYKEMMEWLNIADNVVQYWDLENSNLFDMFETNFNNRQNLHNQLKNKLPGLKEKAYKAIDLINEELNENY